MPGIGGFGTEKKQVRANPKDKGLRRKNPKEITNIPLKRRAAHSSAGKCLPLPPPKEGCHRLSLRGGGAGQPVLIARIGKFVQALFFSALRGQ